MCKGIDDLITSSKREQAIESARTMQKDGMPLALIAKYVNATEAQVKEWLAAAAV